METRSRSRKRAEALELMPADKRACNGASTSASCSRANEAPPKTLDHKMESSGSVSGEHVEGVNGDRKDGGNPQQVSGGPVEGDNGNPNDGGNPQEDSDYASSSDSEEDQIPKFEYGNAGVWECPYGNRKTLSDKIKRVVSSIVAGPKEHGSFSMLALLTELCDYLPFCMEDCFGSVSLDSFVPVLVGVVKEEGEPDTMLLAVRALTHLCDVMPKSCAIVVRHNAVHAFCARLMAVQYVDVAEQCLRALEKISRDHAAACLHSGAIMAVLPIVDFFSTGIQRVALSTAANICKKLDHQSYPLVIDAIPILCNLLQYEDQKLVENVAICLIRIGEALKGSSDKLDELCKLGVIAQALHLISSNSRIIVSKTTYSGLIGLLSILASGSSLAVKVLFDLNISHTLRDILACSDLAPSTVYSSSEDLSSKKMLEVLNLLNVLLPPPSPGDEKLQSWFEKEKHFKDQPEFLRQFGLDILPILIQVVGSGATVAICYSSLSVMNKLIYFSPSDMLLNMLEGTNISSFLGSVLRSKDLHVLIAALHIVELAMQKCHDTFQKLFVKEGVLYAVDALLLPEKLPDSHALLQQPTSSSVKPTRCLCFSSSVTRSPSSEVRTCHVNKEMVCSIAKRIKDTYFHSVSKDANVAFTEMVQKMKDLCSELRDNADISITKGTSARHERYLSNILESMVSELIGEDQLSTFEFIESGIVNSFIDYLYGGRKVDVAGLSGHIEVFLKRFQKFAALTLSSPSPHCEVIPLTAMVRNLQSVLTSLEHFPVVSSHVPKPRSSYSTIPGARSLICPCFRVHFVRAEGDATLSDFSSDVLAVDPLSSMESIEEYLWPRVCKSGERKSVGGCVGSSEGSSSLTSPSIATHGTGHRNTSGNNLSASSSKTTEKVDLDTNITGASINHEGSAGVIEGSSQTFMEIQGNKSEISAAEIKTTVERVPAVSGGGVASFVRRSLISLMRALPFVAQANNTNRRKKSVAVTDVSATAQTVANKDLPSKEGKSGETPSSSDKKKLRGTPKTEHSIPKLNFCLHGKVMNRSLSLYQAIIQQENVGICDINVGPKIWSDVYQITYGRATKPCIVDHEGEFQIPFSCNNGMFLGHLQYFRSILSEGLSCELDKSDPIYNVLLLLKVLEGLNRFSFHIKAHNNSSTFAEGRVDKFDALKATLPSIPQKEFVSSKLTEKLEQQMQDPLAITDHGLPSWCRQLITSCPFLFSFESKSKYFQLAASGTSRVPQLPSTMNSGRWSILPHDIERLRSSHLTRRKFSISRRHILDSASKIMSSCSSGKIIVEVEYEGEVGTGLGPTLEFYTLVSREFQKVGLGMWRDTTMQFHAEGSSQVQDSGFVVALMGLFPCPWSSSSNSSNGIQFSEVIKKFTLLGQIVAKALEDGRLLDLPFSRAFYKLILGEDLDLYDIQLFDAEFGKTLQEMKAIVDRKRYLESVPCRNKRLISSLSFRDTKIEDLCLDFTVPGYSDYILKIGPQYKQVNIYNLDEYVSSMVDATVGSGISRQVEAFKSGFNQILPLEYLKIFAEDELERLLCGEINIWQSDNLLDEIKFDHGYTASSPPVINLLEIIQEFGSDQRRAFLQFVTGAPRLPPGGFAALNPKLTIVRKHFGDGTAWDLPSVMTCANYLKLPPYSSKDQMRERLLYAITEGQGSFHLS
ncbi:E3 ubiquitin-protein ligase UPL4 isoform X1 [Amborella trichopoda]|uniref:HECT-type E3 ubiquitin transferase n=1 Tax=Amborella trichopoda TaxID=13333 RepID=W1P4U6_AMBTC|nr:E3 ubiquitin-protein ligase UPL4 isoform X1 [Amborella trichopoda]ERN04907.1 hypothetical protein AMTR_s00080p00063640 [Amborella trichopoda]|eukprot:XP_006843232.1 E3 ubiquitin-protein ligase UPL4 isoform X1 [Amborella trichopoda]